MFRTLLLFVVLSFRVLAAEPKVIEVYGDSMSTGFLSNTSVLQPMNEAKFKELRVELAKIALRSTSTPLNHKALSWVMHVAEGLGADEVFNAAVERATTNQLAKQVSKKRKKWGNTSFFVMGTNDISLRGMPPSQMATRYEAEMSRALSLWDEMHENAVAYVLPVADVSSLYKSLADHSIHMEDGVKRTCAEGWNTTFAVYAHDGFETFKTLGKETLFADRAQAMNQRMGEVLEKWAGKKERGNAVHFLKEVFTSEIEPENFAIDCYHLSEKGQQVLAGRILQEIEKVH